MKLWCTIASALKVFIGILILICIGESIYCYNAYNGAYLQDFVLQTILLAGILAIFLVLSTALTTLFYHQIDPLPALQGAAPGRSLLLTSWLLHAFLLIVAASLTLTAFTNNHRLNTFTTYLEQIKKENLSIAQFGGVYTPSQETEIWGIIKNWINEIDQRGETLAAKHTPFMHGSTLIDIFYVNETYLNRNLTQIKLSPDNLDAIHVYRPSGITDEAFEMMLENIAFQTNTELKQLILHPVEHTGTFPAYSVPTSTANTLVTSVNNPVLVVLPHGSSALAEFALAGNGLYITNGSETLTNIPPNAEIKRYLRGITPLSVIANQTIASASRDTITAVFAVFAGIAALIIVTLTGVVSYAQYARKRLKIQFLFGWRLGSMYLWFVCLEALSLLFLGAWFYREWQAFQAEQDSLSTATSSLPFYVASASTLVFVLSFTVFIFSTAFVHYQITQKEVLK